MLALAIAACASSNGSGTDPLSASVGQNGTGAAVMANATDDAKWPSDPLSIESASVAADTLVAMVVHGGGCASHGYQLVVSSAFMESFPVQVNARISHDAHGDLCKALIRRELRFSLAPLAAAYRDAYKQPHGTVAIRLSGWSNSLLFSF